MFGVAVTAGFFSYQLLTDAQSPLSRNPMVMLLFVVLCPPSLLAVALGTDVLPIWIVVALLNAALYVGVRALAIKLLRRSG